MVNQKINNYKSSENILNDKNILITGATDGIGRALALQSANLGARVIIHGRNRKKLEAIHDEIVSNPRSKKPTIAMLDFEIATSENYSSLSESIMDNFDCLDGLIHCAGILGDRSSIEQYDPGLWQKVMHVNLTAPFVLTQALMPNLKLSKQPSIIYTSSGVGQIGKAFWGAYCVSKFGTEALSQILSQELIHTSFRVNCINPGAVKTKMRLAAYPAENRDKLKSPHEIIDSYIYLLDDQSIGVTGKCFDAQ
jgi:NAD(P)-dependent dehydrogenase (short-subunit alcohol dehydrogenase family)|tara:strand:+ start:21862 stop:22617 length:756 start_codon:yes stop_codon:yes gene_type:complete